MKHTTLLILLYLSGAINAQINSSYLDHNNVSVYLSDAGTYFFDYENSTMGYEVPKGSNQFAIYSTQFWFAGKDANDSIRFVQGASPGNGSDVFSGPVCNPAVYLDSSYQNGWSNSIWEICQEEIDSYKVWWEACAGPNADANACANVIQPSNESLSKIYSWPAHGDVTLGQSYWMAPFFDNNSDGIYDPTYGDYPQIKGCCATYMIQNDAAATHTYSGTDSMRIEFHYMFYQYQTWDYLNDVTFVDVKAVNRGNEDYTEFVYCIEVDSDLGNFADDYFGCDSASNCMYFYNADNFDENGGVYLGYGIDPPAIGVVCLDKDMTACVPYNSGSTVNSKWNLLNGKQANGSDWLDPNATSTNYVFSGNPTNPSAWSALAVGYPTGDASSLASTYHGAFNSGDTITQTYAILYARTGNHLENVQKIIDLSAEVKVFFDNESNTSCNEATWNVPEFNSTEFNVYPNPSSGMLHIENSENTRVHIEIRDITGKLIYTGLPTTQSSISINVEEIPRGIYLINLNTEQGKTVRKIIRD